MGTLFAPLNQEGCRSSAAPKVEWKCQKGVDSVTYLESLLLQIQRITLRQNGKHRRSRPREGRVGDVRPPGSKLPEHCQPGSTRGGTTRLSAGERRQGRQEEPVRPGRACRSGSKGRPVHACHCRKQADSHRRAGEVSARASQEGAGGREAQCSAPQDCLQLQESSRKDTLRIQAASQP